MAFLYNKRQVILSAKDKREARLLNEIGLPLDELDYRWFWGPVDIGAPTTEKQD